MKSVTAIAAFLTILSMGPGPAEPASEAAHFWPQWRGPQGNGVAPHASPPVEWSENHNVRWKIPIPGKGSATPAVWGELVFVLSGVPTGETVESEESQGEPSQDSRRSMRTIEPNQMQQFTIFAVDRDDGSIGWKRVLREELPHEGTHPTGTWASSSPVTDGRHVYAYFGSRGLYCLDMAGNLLWEKDLGDMEIRNGFGEGSSPVLHNDRIIINWDHQGQSFIVALNKETGEEIWRTNRNEITSWTTPLVVEFDGGKQVVVSATGKVRSYDFENGALIWESEGMTLNAIPSPVASGDLVFVTSGFRGNALLAIRLSEARGDITNSAAIAWSYDRDTPYTPSPLLYEGTLYFLKSNNGILSSFNARTGKPNYGPVRLEEVPNIYASPVGAANRVYIAGRDGNTAVIEHGSEFKLLAVNRLDDGFDASPAMVGGEIYLRGRNLYRISED